MEIDINTIILLLRLTIFRDAAPESCQVRPELLEPLSPSYTIEQGEKQKRCHPKLDL